MSKSTITYRFDHSERPRTQHKSEPKEKQIIPLNQEEYEVKSSPEAIVDTQQLNQFTTDFGAWSSPFDAETDELERLIRDTDRQSMLSDKQIYQNKVTHQDLYEPPYDAESGFYETSSTDEKSSSTTRYLRRSKVPISKILTSISGAIVTGTIFGFFIMSMFSGDGDSIPIAIDDITAGENAIIQQENKDSVLDASIDDPFGEASVEAGATALNVVQVQIPSESFYLLQNGVFSSSEGAEIARNELLQQGYAATSELADNYYVYAGIFTNREDALLLSYLLEQNNFESFIKEYAVTDITTIRWKGELSEGGDEYFTEGYHLMDLIITATAEQLQLEGGGSTTIGSLSDIQLSHQHWNQLAVQISDGVPDDWRQPFQRMNNAMNTAVKSLDEYNKNPSPSYLWQAQSSIMDYGLLQKQMLESISSS